MDAVPSDAPLVSVIIPTYKRRSTLPACLESVLTQTLSDIEVIVVDDCSRDGTIDFVEGVEDPRIILVEHETNRGGNAARASGIARATGRWIAFLDSDDQWLPQKLERQIDLLRKKGPDFGLCAAWVTSVDPEGNVVGTIEPVLDGDATAELLCRNVLGTFSAVLIDAETLVRAGGVDESLPACQDWDLYVRVSRLAKVCVVREHLVRYLVDPRDPVRITSSSAKVVAGLRHMYGYLRAYGSHVPATLRLDGSRRYLEAFSDEGAVGDVLCVARDSLQWSGVRNAGHGAHMVARSIRRAVRSANVAQQRAAEAAGRGQDSELT